jgi:hypothetical protein
MADRTEVNGQILRQTDRAPAHLPISLPGTRSGNKETLTGIHENDNLIRTALTDNLSSQ